MTTELQEPAAQLPAVIEQAARSPLNDLRQAALSVPVEVMRAGLDEYAEKRNTFRAWLLSQMTEGVHYGFPPGCSGSVAKEIEYKKRPSLYKAGAEFVADLLGLRAEFIPLLTDPEWINKPNANICVECKLWSRQTGELMGQGLGGRTVGTKKMDFNASLKMAQKSSLVMAVLSCYGLSDLFTQDMEDYAAEAHEPPPSNPNAAKAAPRGERVTKEQLQEQLNRYRQLHPNDDREALASYCKLACGHPIERPTNAACWTVAELADLEAAITREMESGIPF